MKQAQDFFEKIAAGEVASIENTGATALAISLISDNGCHIEFELLSKQVIGFSAGGGDGKVVLHRGDPAALLVIKPESAS